MPSTLGDVVARVGEHQGDVATLLLHGAAGSWATWLPLIEQAQRIGNPLANIVALDLPGWGESGELPKGASVSAMSDVIAEAATALGYSEWSVMGHSLGGHLALDLAVSNPLQTRAVTLISATGPGAAKLLRHPLRRFSTLPWLAGMLVAMRVLSVLGSTAFPLVHQLHRLGLLRPLSAPLFAFPRSVDDDVITGLSLEIRPRAFLRAAKAAADYDEETWSEIRCRVLAIHGERDVFVGSRDGAWFDQHIARMSHGVIGEAGHFAHAEQPGLVLELYEQGVLDLEHDSAGQRLSTSK